MAFAIVTFPTTIFYSTLFSYFYAKKQMNSKDTKKNSGFHRFYGSLLNGKALSIHRSSFFHQKVL